MLNVSILTTTIIAGVPIEDKLFDEEKVNYRLIEREEFIDDLIGWIGEIGYFNKDRERDKFLMKQDLKYLMSLDDKFIFSNISTNEYIAQSDDEENFAEICKEILIESGLTEAGADDALSGECM
jgi:hypothetical protein